ncbi:MAG: outer membrane lipoprotein-sorting protein [Sphaerochaetaceae bacterium]|jgi:outer membrane lipoprotein-sorting protein|nr:outer membrane lipoprotein-sorting protein [Sphaerochaetaceae bacterium]MDC7237852.1 outer membrane lipoprotein-sorting protein [Sphaerochaetaceae bacterium]MDC7249722.1 outer membrane lipoprotein-sorting protein [Sphaerochaetaceae bacterium]
MKKIITIIFIAAVTFNSAFATTIEEGTEILKIIDSQSNFEGSDFSATLSMISEDPEDGIEKTVVYQFRDDDDDKFLLLIKEPTINKGQGYLLIDDNLWFYDPDSRKFSHTSMKEQFNDSDANNSDFTSSSLLEDYNVVAVEEGKLGSYDVNILSLEATNNEVTYPFQEIYVSKQGTVTLKKEEFSKSGTLLRTSYYTKYKLVDGNYVATYMIFQDELIEGKKTTIQISNISTDDIPDSVFTKSYIERVNN